MNKNIYSNDVYLSYTFYEDIPVQFFEVKKSVARLLVVDLPLQGVVSALLFANIFNCMNKNL